MSGSDFELCIEPTHPCLAGHFPAQPIVPGVLLLDAVLQALESQALVTGWHIASIKFHRALRAAQTVRAHFEPADAAVRFELRSAEGVIASGSAAAVRS